MRLKNQKCGGLIEDSTTAVKSSMANLNSQKGYSANSIIVLGGKIYRLMGQRVTIISVMQYQNMEIEKNLPIIPNMSSLFGFGLHSSSIIFIEATRDCNCRLNTDLYRNILSASL